MTFPPLMVMVAICPSLWMLRLFDMLSGVVHPLTILLELTALSAVTLLVMVPPLIVRSPSFLMTYQELAEVPVSADLVKFPPSIVTEAPL